MDQEENPEVQQMIHQFIGYIFFHQSIVAKNSKKLQFFPEMYNYYTIKGLSNSLYKIYCFKLNFLTFPCL